ncbi:hypothetical protein PMAN_a3631 [Pseudoalteromonas marina]|nr:hypothetical protein PMAN_a3631 [Pseudoalteromonas marina]
MLALSKKCNEKFNSVTNDWLKYSWFGAKVVKKLLFTTLIFY